MTRHKSHLLGKMLQRLFMNFTISNFLYLRNSNDHWECRMEDLLLFTKPNIEVSSWLYQPNIHITHVVYQPFSRVPPPNYVALSKLVKFLHCQELWVWFGFKCGVWARRSKWIVSVPTWLSSYMKTLGWILIQIYSIRRHHVTCNHCEYLSNRPGAVRQPFWW